MGRIGLAELVTKSVKEPRGRGLGDPEESNSSSFGINSIAISYSEPNYP
jgi:hypothetical protein